MRQLIDIAYKDGTSYPAQVSGDVGGIIIAHPWGPVDKIVKVSFEGFLNQFPLVKGMIPHPTYLSAYRAFQAGLRTIEVVRVASTTEKYIAVEIAEEPTQTVVGELDGITSGTIVGKFPGNFPIMLDKSYNDFELVITTTSATEGAIEDEFDVTFELQATNVITGVTEVIETVIGGSVPGRQVDGSNWFIGDRLNESGVNLQFLGDSLTGLVASDVITVELTPQDITLDSCDDLSANYSKYFNDIEVSEVSIIFDPGVTEAGSAANLIAVANFRSDCVAIVGYPTGNSFIEEDIRTYHTSLTPEMYGAFYATREQVKLDGKSYQLNGMGTIAGRLASVASTESVNQLPSAKTWGAFGGTIAKALPFEIVLAMHKDGINSVYATASGPRIFGLRSLHPRATSYFSKFNVSRVIARLLKYTLGVAMDVIHTGNTDQKKALTQNLLNSDLNRLKGVGALRVQSSVTCDHSNNSDLDSNGGEYLIIDYECWFVKLIERVKINILATDSSVSASVTQG